VLAQTQDSMDLSNFAPVEEGKWAMVGFVTRSDTRTRPRDFRGE
jgi:hypothetical protein